MSLMTRLVELIKHEQNLQETGKVFKKSYLGIWVIFNLIKEIASTRVWRGMFQIHGNLFILSESTKEDLPKASRF